MVRISVLGNALKTILNAERAGKKQVLIRPSSKIVLNKHLFHTVLEVIKSED